MSRFCLLLLFNLCIVFTTLNLCHGKCNRDSGPSGLVECFLGTPYYTKYQWGTCLTNAYIQQKSGGKYHCADRTATYCYYQCMVEVHDLDRGPVYSDCACTPGATPPPTASTTPSLPGWCYSPDGSDCSWYRECLEKRYPCEGSQNGYAVTYAEKFCSLYTSSSSSFSSTGQNWINAVRKCLQVALVPLLRPWEHPSCSDIKKRAFDSHTPCYLEPYAGAPSICNLTAGDWWKIFWTVKSSFIQAAGPSLKGVLETMMGCGNSYLDQGYKFIRTIKLKVTKRFRRTDRSVDDDSLDTYAGEIADSIANSLDWKSQGVGWFAYTSNDSLSDDQQLMNMTIIIADKFRLDANSNGQSTLSLNHTLDRFADAVRRGTINIRVRGVSENISIKKLFACEDVQCHDIFMDVTGAAVNVTRASVNVTGAAVNVTGAAMNVTGAAVNVTGADVDVRPTVVMTVIFSLHLMYVCLKLMGMEQ